MKDKEITLEEYYEQCEKSQRRGRVFMKGVVGLAIMVSIYGAYLYV